MNLKRKYSLLSVALGLTLCSSTIVEAQSIDTVCYGAFPAQFKSTANASGSQGDTAFVYEWQDSTASSLAWNTTSGISADTAYQAVGLTETTWFRRKVSVAACLEIAYSNTIEVLVLDSLSPTISDLVNANCANTADGSATLNLSGGLVPYQFVWDNGERTATATALDSGLHFVTITDDFGCEKVASINVGFDNLPPSFGFDADTVSLASELTPIIGAPTEYNNYSWSTGSTDSIINVTSPGTYSLTVTDTNGCSSSDSVYVILTVGIAEGKLDFEAKVFPNPTRDEVNVVVGNSQTPDNVEIRTLDGKLVIQKQKASLINISQLSGGVYLIDVNHNGETVRKKLIVQ